VVDFFTTRSFQFLEVKGLNPYCIEGHLMTTQFVFPKCPTGLLELILAVTLVGCGGSSGPQLYHVSGKVTFDGKPLPFGTIVFEPDKGNSGPQGFAEIRDGEFDTRSAKGEGVVGGKVVASITGFEKAPPDSGSDEPIPALFEQYVVQFEVPMKNLTRDFEVPKDAVNKKPGSVQQNAGP
jgi:hypothetical protein